MMIQIYLSYFTRDADQSEDETVKVSLIIFYEVLSYNINHIAPLVMRYNSLLYLLITFYLIKKCCCWETVQWLKEIFPMGCRGGAHENVTLLIYFYS